MSKNPKPTNDDFPVAPWKDEAAKAANIKSIIVLLGIASTLTILPLLLTSNNPALALVAALFSAMSWSCLWFLNRGKVHQVAIAVVVIALVAAIGGVLAMGTVRAAMGFVFVGAVAGAGVFLDRKALIATVVLSALSLSVLTWLETQGMLRMTDTRVGLPSLMVHVATLLVVAQIVYFSRSRERMAVERYITEYEQRRSVELQRDLSNNRFANIFRTSPSPMVAQSARTGNILDVNPAFERAYGYRKDQVLGHTDRFLWADTTARTDYRNKLLNQKRVHQFETEGLRADGTKFKILLSTEIGTGDDDRLVMTTVTDISEQSRALEKLQRSEDRFSKAFNFSPLNMAITRISDDVILEVNLSSDPAQGLKPENMRGKKALDLGFWLTAQERQHFVAQLAREGHILAHEMKMRHVDGHVVHSRVWAEPIEIDGEPCILTCTVNIDAEKQREALLTDIAKGMSANSSDTFYDALTRHMALALNADKVLLAELADGPSLTCLSAFEDGAHAPATAGEPLEGPCQQALNQSLPYLIEAQLADAFSHEPGFSADGYQAYLGLSLRDEQQRPIGLLKAMWRQPIMVTPQLQALLSIYASRANAELLRLQRDREIQRLNEQLEDRVRQRTADLQRLNAELDSFAYSVSHDLKTPLRSIDGFTQLLGEQLQGRLNAEENRLFVRILTSTQRMSQLIADLLALARVSQGGLERSHVDLSGMAEQFLQAEQGKQPDRAVRWRVSSDLQCQGDQRLARIGLDNLLGNALKYTRNNAATEIEVGQWPAESLYAGTFYVRDNGVGFNMVHRDKLFKPFQRLHMPSDFDGTGIGLATVRRIAERHGGFIVGHGQEGRGAVFAFSFSARAVPPPDDILAAMLAEAPAVEG